MSSNKWLSSGRYGITRGVYKRLWTPKPHLSVVIIPSINKASSGRGMSEILVTESDMELSTENGVELVVVE